jgi:hypothetical protein
MQIGDFILPTIWKQIQDFPNYEVSICGQVRNFKTKRILKPDISSKGYYRIGLQDNNKCKIKHYIHRLVLINFIPNVENYDCVDHINGIRLDNTISNLRWCSNQQNCYNRSVSKRNSSSIKGVTWTKDKKRWRALISFDGKRIHIGYFVNLEDAIIARRQKAKELFGEFLNDCEK